MTNWLIRSKRFPTKLWEPVIGLEVHAQINSRTKLFSHMTYSTDAMPNSLVSPVDAAMPGSLPILSSEYIPKIIMLGLALGCKVHECSSFDRKHYFYYDLPAGYQITQKFEPIATNGHLQLTNYDGLPYNSKHVGISQLQLEQDTAKLISNTDEYSTLAHLTDLNRANMGLAEIVMDPDLRSSQEAGIVIKKLQRIMRAVGASDASMDDGTMRVDVNVSVRPWGDDVMGVRCELKNLVSIKTIQDAIDTEIGRQIELLDNGDKVTSSTRGYDDVLKETYSLRNKESSMDYRYIPDPDLPPITLNSDYIDNLRQQLPELPDDQRIRLLKLGLTTYQANILIEYPGAVELFDQVLIYKSSSQQQRDPRAVANFIINTLSAELTSHNHSFTSIITRSKPEKKRPSLIPAQISSIIDALNESKVFLHQTKDILRSMLQNTNGYPNVDDILTNINDQTNISSPELRPGHVDYGKLLDMAKSTLDNNPKAIKDLKKGKMQVMMFLMGKVMRSVNGRADPRVAQQVLIACLQERGIEEQALKKWHKQQQSKEKH